MVKVGPHISVIVPNYNHDKYLRQRLESIFNQTYSNFEVILLDDCSTDNSRKILLEYKNNPKTSHCVLNQVNSGSTFFQWNKGIKLAKGDYIWIAESDDFCDETFLESLISTFKQDPEIALTFCQSHRVDSKGKVTGNWITHTSHFSQQDFLNSFIMNGYDFLENYLVHKNVIPNVSAVLFKKAKLMEIMPLDFQPYMKYNADWYYYIQISCNSKIAFIAESLNYFRYHENSVIARADDESGWFKIFKMELQARKLMMQYIKQCNPPNLKAIVKKSNKGNDWLHYLTAMGFVQRGNTVRGISLLLFKPQLLKKVVIHMIRM